MPPKKRGGGKRGGRGRGGGHGRGGRAAATTDHNGNKQSSGGKSEKKQLEKEVRQLLHGIGSISTPPRSFVYSRVNNCC